ncbi:MAG: SCE4755 family polysaccharide monooxygenase-like protein [Kofleriaceae bacterium]
MRSLVVAAALLSTASVASAHVRITSPTPRSSTDLKQRHCGMAGSARANVQTYAPGATLHLVWNEYIAHPGWLRISFNPNGDTFRIPPGDPAGTPAGYPTENMTGMTDPTSGSVIIADRIPSGTTSWDVTLPTAECSNCTLQLIQMMTDKPPYTVDAASNDIYFACVDLVISAGGPLIDAGTDPDGGGAVDAGDADGDAGIRPSDVSSGCGCQGGADPSGLAVLGAGVGWLLRRRRRA